MTEKHLQNIVQKLDIIGERQWTRIFYKIFTFLRILRAGVLQKSQYNIHATHVTCEQYT